MSKNELSQLMARTIKGDFVDFTECANEVFKEFERIQAENKGLKKRLERIAIIAELAAMGDTSDLKKSL